MIGAAALIAPGTLCAQTGVLPGTNEVLARGRPGYDPKGLPVGALRLFPRLDVDYGYNDNIYNTDVLVVRDRVLTVVPQASLRSDWSRHSVTVDASATFSRYARRETENSDQYRLSASGRYDIARTVSVDAAARYTRTAEPRGTLGDQLVGGDPILFRTRGASLGTTVLAGRLTLRGTGSVDRFTYDNVRIGTTVFSQAYRDRDSTTFSGQAGVLVSPNVTVYGSASYNRQSYNRESGTLTLDAHGYSLLGGVGFEVTRLISARIDAGYLHQSFRDPRFRSISAPSYVAVLTWNPTPLVSVGLDARKIVQQSPSIGLSGIVTNAVSASVDYELLRRLLVDVELGYTVDDYRGLNRTDRRLSGRIGARYLLERHLAVGVSYEHRQQRSSPAGGREFDGNTVMLTLRFQA